LYYENVWKNDKIINMNDYLEFAKNLAKEAEEIALRYFSFETENTWKGDDTLLTVADTEINDLVIKRINETYPSHSIYGEEKSDKKEGSEYVWVCDPIDETMPFSNGLPMFVFSLALVEQSIGCIASNGILHQEILECVQAGKLDK
jgi:fructose-1,6-bisphosphatase/inositol monophosphatase family enzyme